MAQFYDFQSRPDWQATMSFEEDGVRAGTAFLRPTRAADLDKKYLAYLSWATASSGLTARSPDYMNAFFAGIGMTAPMFGQIDARAGEVAESLYQRARRADWNATHTFVSPFADRQRAPGPFAGGMTKVDVQQDAICVSGCRGIATNALFCDVNMNFEFHPTGANGKPYLLIFVVPTSAPGLSFAARASFHKDGGDVAGSLRNSVDELDAIAFFEDVVIPRDDVIYLEGDAASTAIGTIAPIFMNGVQLTG